MMKGSIRVGRIFGIEVDIHYSWLVVMGLVWVSLATGYFPSAYPRMQERAYWAIAMVTALLFFGSILFHELCHSVVANKRNVSVSRITLFVFGGIAHLRGEVRDAATEFRIAAAGPAASLGLAVIFFLLHRLALLLGWSPFLASPSEWLAIMNTALAVFNLLPGLPLDGGRLLRAAIWHFTKSFVKATRVAAGTGTAFAYLLMAFGITQMVWGRGSWTVGIWYLLIGWFLHNAAQSSFGQATLEQALSGTKVEDVMAKEPQVMPPNISLQEAVDEFFLAYRYAAFPVVEGGEVLGMIHIGDIRGMPRLDWPVLTVREAMKPLDRERMVVHPDQEAVAALMKMAESGEGRLLVLERGLEGRLVGLLTRTDLMNLIRVKTGLGV